MNVRNDTRPAHARRYDLYNRPGPLRPLPQVISRLQPLIADEGANPLTRARLKEALALPANELSVLLRAAEQYRLLELCEPDEAWTPSAKALAIVTGKPGELARVDALFLTARTPRLFGEMMAEAFPLQSAAIRNFLYDQKLPSTIWPVVARAYNKTMAFLEEALLGEIMPREQAALAFRKVLDWWHDGTFPSSVEGLANPLGLDCEDEEGELMHAYHYQLAFEQFGLL